MAHNSSAPFLSFSQRSVGRGVQAKARQEQSEGKRAATPQSGPCEATHHNRHLPRSLAACLPACLPPKLLGPARQLKAGSWHQLHICTLAAAASNKVKETGLPSLHTLALGRSPASERISSCQSDNRMEDIEEDDVPCHACMLTIKYVRWFFCTTKGTARKKGTMA
jgi:hypothetical protein